MERKDLGLYIHIPFCRSKCHYCDFNSFPGKEELIPGYFDALEKEIRLYSDLLKDSLIKTVFIGGGTPSLAEPKYIYKLLGCCRDNFNLAEGAEISVEANPGTLTYEKLMAYKVSGANRLSIGLQAAQKSILERLGRTHKFEEFRQGYILAEKTGFRNINVDLIFGIPGQDIKDWTDTVEKVLSFNPAHLSCYSLKIEEGTVFGNMLEAGKLEPAEDELDRKMYRWAIEKLGECGYRHYEISNFARPGFECRHNLIYWKGEEYLGIGAGAHSYLNGSRFNNLYAVEEYIASLNSGKIPSENVQTIERDEEMSEFMILGLRLIAGISKGEFRSRFGIDIYNVFGQTIKKLEESKMLKAEGDFIMLTDLGLDLANEVFVEFIK
ncbi:MAG: radical SAM family heme chaperone HemW [Clostridia bacterium]|nr:radical SAM family heme chaperone HemW [Clostridia bacterium]